MMETVDNVKKTNTVDDAINDSQENTASGKKLCDKLKDIRKSVADKYELNYEPADCHHEGDCAGTCPKCDEELLDLQSQLSQKGITDIDVKQSIDGIADVDDVVDVMHGFVCPEQYIGEMEDAYAPEEHVELQEDVEPTPRGMRELMSHGRLQGCVALPSPPPPHRRFVTSCQLTGLANHKFDSIKHKINVGTKLALIPDATGTHGKDAVAVALVEDYNGNPEDFNFDAAIGYIPKKEEELCSKILKIGWNDRFEVEVCSIDGDKPNDDSITLALYFKD